ncbi:putative lipid II flippase FtsW [Thermoactinomyces sp. DSM 45892]|uniref:putative lipid II flippase FtsW n=1 Tax=Thermoactinomyces sp. DSM 45892 TaxID=1882753 RepID=UPI000898EC62|nr:putative lipid II flippase FtsW [Thermoactinomyces sp. DSM 45892]SDY68199.1 cell division protein FtsW [Thermoactinomyces sp. DSM 45892]
MKRGKPDFWLILVIFMLVGFGLIMVFSTSYYKGLVDYQNSYYFFQKQLMFTGVGFLAFFIAINIPYTFYRKHIGKFLLITVPLLISVFFLAREINGSQRWLVFGPVSVQPSEIAKIVMIIYTASIMVKKQSVMNQFSKALFPPLVVIGLICGLLLAQPHYSGMMIVLTTCLAIIFCSGARVRHLFGMFATIIPIALGVLFIRDYRIDRIMAIWDPFKYALSEGMQTVYSLYAIGPGGLLGAGLGNSIQKLDYLPEAHTDFIFSIIAEELGFIGGLFMILLFLTLIIRGILIAARAPDQFGTLLGVGIVTLIGIEAIFNLGVVTALLPATGIPLPFISYGGSALIIKLFAMGMLLNISRYSSKKANTKTVKETPVNA